MDFSLYKPTEMKLDFYKSCNISNSIAVFNMVGTIEEVRNGIKNLFLLSALHIEMTRFYGLGRHYGLKMEKK